MSDCVTASRETKADFPGEGSQLATGTSGLEWSAEYYRAAEELEQGGSLSQTVSQSTINSARPAFSSSSPSPPQSLQGKERDSPLCLCIKNFRSRLGWRRPV